MQTRWIQGMAGAMLVLAVMTGGATAVEHTKDSLATIKKNVADEKALMIDVRTEDEWKDGHLAIARLLPLANIQRAIPEKDLDKSKIIYLHCKSGRRCVTAAEILIKAGYDARPLKQGYEELVKSGFDPAKPNQP